MHFRIHISEHAAGLPDSRLILGLVSYGEDGRAEALAQREQAAMEPEVELEWDAAVPAKAQKVRLVVFDLVSEGVGTVTLGRSR
jgi:hypothetical protein